LASKDEIKNIAKLIAIIHQKSSYIKYDKHFSESFNLDYKKDLIRSLKELESIFLIDLLTKGNSNYLTYQFMILTHNNDVINLNPYWIAIKSFCIRSSIEFKFVCLQHASLMTSDKKELMETQNKVFAKNRPRP
jgi:hypothetical protein